MRIYLPLHAHHFLPQATAGPSQTPLIQIGGHLVLLELQGQLSYEGEKDGGVVGVLGLDRPDKPTLHLGEHHLLHGKFTNLPKPYAVIRRVIGIPKTKSQGSELGTTVAIDGDVDDEESEESEDEEEVMRTPIKRNKGKGKAKNGNEVGEDEEEQEPPLFALNNQEREPETPNGRSSSPFYPSSAARDFSSELDMNSPARQLDEDDEGEDGEEEDEKERRKRVADEVKRVEAKRKRKELKIKEGRDRTRHYEVVGVVRRKVVFALRPEPIVTATILPE